MRKIMLFVAGCSRMTLDMKIMVQFVFYEI